MINSKKPGILLSEMKKIPSIFEFVKKIKYKFKWAPTFKKGIGLLTFLRVEFEVLQPKTP